MEFFIGIMPIPFPRETIKAVSSFAERLRQAMFDKHCKAVAVVRGTKIGASVISKYLSGMNQPSRDNLLALEKFLEVTPEWLISSSDAPESKNTVQSKTPPTQR